MYDLEIAPVLHTFIDKITLAVLLWVCFAAWRFIKAGMARAFRRITGNAAKIQQNTERLESLEKFQRYVCNRDEIKPHDYLGYGNDALAPGLPSDRKVAGPNGSEEDG